MAAKKTATGSFQWCLVTGQETVPETKEVPSDCQKALFHWKGDWTLAQVAQSGCEISYPRDSQKAPGLCPGEHFLCDLPCAGVAGQDAVQQPFPTSSYDSVIKTVI